ncbi:site-specific recombinase : Site-specific recombinase OS=Rhizobium fredii (strain HH103) GN=SFHH103_03916 PE=4 SV=1: Resolvase: Recombinase [Gemmata massiliana]|uniref:Resolvase/invertase-type recombinase catalytic domain-containing protein n=1 Tax=Gemmata massiliana TaxID=1210884 RepID=A0A6P2CZC4_9BACT|nr:recombinase family protein [Gemmata massiliana]VTR94239.1 site-specific recombinase : Site-specific recombinase OS=Rhizobium fredii (strain HH103) GN=SFHH103_03916 PE=4 SV=1: Resolvase: Recombinase [Gemmata massiliana]
MARSKSAPSELPVAYSYIRFSTPDQGAGDSIRRQESLRDDWCARNGVRLVETLRDYGISAFKGRHRADDRAALGRFLSLVKAGTVKPGSYLVVEQFDRLSREQIRPALTLLLNLIEAGVRVVQLMPVEKVYGEDVEPMALMMAIMELSRGHSESMAKSGRGGLAWANKRKQATQKVLTRIVPAWCKIAGEKIVLDEPKAEVVRRIYNMALGGRGVPTIAKTLNIERVAPLSGRSKRWAQSSISYILCNRAVIGEYQPHTHHGRERREPDGPPVTGYYPAVLTEEMFNAVRMAMSRRNRKGSGRGDRLLSIFSGLLYDARNGETLHVLNNTVNGRRISPYESSRGLPGYKWVSFPADTFEAAVLSKFREIDAREITGNRQDPTAGAAKRLSEIERRLISIKEQLVSGDEDVGPVMDALRNLEAERKAAADQLRTARQEAASTLVNAWEDCQSLADLLATSPDPADTRARLRAAVHRVVKQVYCLFVAQAKTRIAAVQVWFEGEESHRDYLIVHRSGTGNRVAEWFVRSLVLPTSTAGIDLRKREDVALLEPILESLNLATNE